MTESQPNLTIRAAESEDDLDAVRALCRRFVDWQLEAVPDRSDDIHSYFEPEAFARTLAELPLIHARPKGAILLARLDGQPVGCVMYREFETGIAEIKRLFVDESGRGHGIGRALLTDMFGRMRGDGYDAVKFYSANFLTHARQLYESLGFTEIPTEPGTSGYVYAMERPL